MRTRIEVFQRLDSRFRGNDKQGGNDEGDAFPWSPYPKLGFNRAIEARQLCKLKSLPDAMGKEPGTFLSDAKITCSFILEIPFRLVAMRKIAMAQT